MAMVKKSITVTEHQEVWIQAQLASGNYGTESELIREALREKQAKFADIKRIQRKLVSAEKSGFIDKGRNEILKGFKNKLRANGEL